MVYCKTSVMLVHGVANSLLKLIKLINILTLCLVYNAYFDVIELLHFTHHIILRYALLK